MGPLFHGGTRRLDRVGLILPPSKTGVATTGEYGAGAIHRADRVYLTTELEQARIFAICAPPKGRGDIYECEPIGDLEPDPDYSGLGASWAVPMARIIRVVERNVREVAGLGAPEVAALLTADGDTYPMGDRFQGATARDKDDSPRAA
jgi:rifampin ADP-ribosylating transferase